MTEASLQRIKAMQLSKATASVVVPETTATRKAVTVCLSDYDISTV